MPQAVVYLVANGVVLAAYWQSATAEAHARTVTGGRVVTMIVLDELAPEARADIETESDDFDEWEESLTPVQAMEDDE